LESAYLSYLTKKTFNYSRLDADISVKRESFAARTLAPAESAALRAGFHAAMGRPVEARGLLDEARKTDPNLAAAHEVEGLLFDAEMNRDGAREAFGRAVDQESSSYYAKYRWAYLTWRAKPEPDRQTLTRAQRLLEQSARQNPRFLFTYVVLAEVRTRLEGAEAALPIAERAVSLAPDDAETRLLLARVLWGVHRREEAQQEAARALAVASTDFLRQAARNLIASFERNAASAAGQPAGTASPR
jgi:tetratricopeptide (TPR) repeat protein